MGGNLGLRRTRRGWHLPCYIPQVLVRRSHWGTSDARRLGRPRDGGRFLFCRRRIHLARRSSRKAQRVADGGRTRGNSSPSSRDRKSTRLNSSHDQISYAVFCLKKK